MGYLYFHNGIIVAELWENTEKEVKQITGRLTETVVGFKYLPLVG